MARTRREVNAEEREQLTKWAAAGATKQEIASRLGISHDTLPPRFAEDPSLQILSTKATRS
jgi:IS30 family transposase